MRVVLAALLIAVAALGARVADTGDGSDCNRGDVRTSIGKATGAATKRASETWADVAEEPSKNSSGAYLATKPEHLGWVAAQANGSTPNDFTGETILISGDLDMGDHDWPVIVGFNGTLDGDDFVLHNLRPTTTLSNARGLGLIMVLKGGGQVLDLHLRNLILEETSIFDASGGVAAVSSGLVRGCSVQGTLRGGLLGGIVGSAGGNIEDCHLLAGSFIQADYMAGGIASDLSDAEISGCSVQGDVALDPAGKTVGGVVGFVNTFGGSTVVKASSFTGTVTGGTGADTSGTGGIVGEIRGTAVVEGCYAAGTVTAASPGAGGIVGYVTLPAASSLIVTDCTNAASVSNNAANLSFEFVGSRPSDAKGAFTGGIVGKVEGEGFGTDVDVAIENCVNRGSVSAAGTPSATYTIPGDESYLVQAAGGILGGLRDAAYIGVGSFGSLRIDACANYGVVGVQGGEYDSVDAQAQYYFVSAGGIMGHYHYSNNSVTTSGIFTSRNEAAVSATAKSVKTNLGMYVGAGGLMGMLHATSGGVTSNIENCYNTGGVSATADTVAYSRVGGGGLVGCHDGMILTLNIGHSYSANQDVGATAIDQAVAYRGGVIGYDTSSVVTTNPLKPLVYNNAGGLDPDGMNYLSGDPNVVGVDFASLGSTFAGWPSPWNAASPPKLTFTGSVIAVANIPGLAEVSKDMNAPAAVAPVLLPDEAVRAAGGYSWTEPTAEEKSLFLSESSFPAGAAASMKGTGVRGAFTIAANGGSVSQMTKVLSLAEKVPTPVPPPDPVVDPGRVKFVTISGIPLILPPDTTIDVHIVPETNSPDVLPDPPVTSEYTVSPEDTELIVVQKVSETHLRIQSKSGIPRQADEIPPGNYEEARLAVDVYQKSGDLDLRVAEAAAVVTVGEPFEAGVDMPQDVVDELNKANGELGLSMVKVLIGNNQPWITPLSPDWQLIRELDNLVMETEMPDDDKLPICFTNAEKPAADVVVNFTGTVPPDKKSIMPMTYIVSVSPEDLNTIFKPALASQILANPVSGDVLDAIFEVLVIHKEIKQGPLTGYFTRLVDGVANPRDAVDSGVLVVEGGARLTMLLNYYVLDGEGEAFLHPDGTANYLVIPDGNHDGYIVDPVWLNRWDAQRQYASASGSGCAVGAAGIAVLLSISLLLTRKNKKTRVSHLDDVS